MTAMKRPLEYRPKIRPEPEVRDRIMEIAGLIGVVILWIIPAIAWSSLPEVIPTHFGIDGRADDWGSKNTLFILPLIATVLYGGMTLLNRYPYIFNYPVKLTEDNAEGMYKRATRMLRIIKLILVLFFTGLEWQITHTGHGERISPWFLVLSLSFTVVLPVVMAFVLTRKSGKERQT
jgi:uncharacterized membrane protein